jgi:hypothetical protein
MVTVWVHFLDLAKRSLVCKISFGWVHKKAVPLAKYSPVGLTKESPVGKIFSSSVDKIFSG